MALVRLFVIAALFGFAGARNIAAALSEIQASAPAGRETQKAPHDDRQIHSTQTLVRQQSSTIPAHETCPRPEPSSAIPEPVDLRSENGVLTVDFAFRSDVDAHGRTRYCYIYKDGVESPNLRLNPGVLRVLRLKNELRPIGPTSVSTIFSSPVQMASKSTPKSILMPMPSTTVANDPCVGAPMNATSTNLHFHGLTVPPVCHQDDVLHTSIQPGDEPFE